MSSSALSLLRRAPLKAFTDARYRPLWRWLLILLLLVISYLALSPAPPRGLDTGWDKLNHLLAFASLMVAAFFGSGRARTRWLTAPLALLAYGGLIELAQSQLPPRTADWHDLLADGIGLALGLVLAAACLTLARRYTVRP